MKVLVVEDDRKVAGFIEQGLREEGYAVDVAPDGDEATMLADRIGVMSARPGVLMETIETGWPRERDSTIVSDARFGEITGRLWDNLRGESMKSLGLSTMAAE